MNNRFGPLFLTAALACSACGSGAPVLKSTAGLDAFSAYCTGTLSKQSSVLLATESGAWLGQGEAVAAGSPVVVGISFGKWVAYGLLSDGTPFQVESDLSKGLSAETDFSASCAAPARLSELPKAVLLRDVKVYGAREETGSACTLKQGTALSSFNFAAAPMQGQAASVAATEIKDSCGFDQAYSSEISYAPLLTK
ncbi:MAG: hypothetical protein U1E65_36285 [Myxococcota bacterium]